MRIFKRILIMIASIVIGIILLIAVAFGLMTKKTSDAISAQVNVDIDMNKIKNGTYIGVSDGGLVQVEVKVTVLNHEITSIELVKHENGKGQSAEVIIDEMVRKNTDNVDAVSGATASSKTIRNAVNCALQKGM